MQRAPPKAPPRKRALTPHKRNRDAMPAGRPTKLNDELQATVCRAIREGVPMETAATVAGISARTFQTWRKRGREELERVAEDGRRSIRKKEEQYVEFLRATTRAQGDCEKQLAKWWHDAGEDDWRAAMELLQRKFPERYSKKSKHEISGPGGEPVQHEWGPPRDEE